MRDSPFLLRELMRRIACTRRSNKESGIVVSSDLSNQGERRTKAVKMQSIDMAKSASAMSGTIQ